MLKKFLLSFVLMFALLLFTSIFRGHIDLLVEDVLISYLIFTIVTWLVIKMQWLSLKPNEVLILFSVGILLTIIIAIIVDQGLPDVGLPNIIMHFVGVFTGYVFHKFSKVFGFVLLAACIAVSVWYIKSGNKYWFNYVYDNTFTGVVQEPAPKDWYFISKDADTLNNTNLKNKTLVLDFWNTSCSVCFRQFPKFDSIYSLYQQDSALVFYAVNVPIKRDTVGQAYNVYYNSTKKHLVHTLFSTQKMGLDFKVTSYPTYLVLKDNVVLYRGNLELFEQYMKKNYPR